MYTPIDAALSVLKTDLRFGEQDPDDPNPMYLDLRRRGFGRDLVDDQGREADFADEFTSAAQRHNNENYVGYYDDDDEYAGYYDEYETSPQELREQAMSELDDKDRAAAARMIDHIKNMDIGNAMFLAHAGGRGFNVPEDEQDALIAQAQQEAAAGQEGAPLFAREGFYGPHNMFRQPEFFDRALPLGPDTKLASLDTPTDVAFSVLKPEEEVRKILPLIIPAAAAIYGGYQGVQNLRENKITDPVLGVVSTEGNDSLGSNLLEFGTGAAQGFIPGAGLKTFLTAGGKKVLSRGAAKQAPKKVAAKRSADKARAAQQQRMSARAQRDELNRLRTTPTVRGTRGHRLQQQEMANLNRQVASNRPERLFDEAADAAALARRTGAGHRFVGNTMTSLGKPLSKPGLLATTALAGAAAYGGKQIADALGNMSMGGGGGTAAPSGSGMGGGQQQQGQFSLAGDPSAGNQNLQNVGVGQTGREQIWQQGGSGTFKGETVTFTHYEGNEMLLKTLENLDKMHCATTKADCSKCGKDCKCDEKKKADDKKSKKPAHGMVIVIGSKNAGPGPSTDGKRDSKD